MSAPPLVESNRFVDPGATRVYAVASIAALASPSRPELDAGVDLTGEMADIAGFSMQAELYESRAADSDFTTTEVGELRASGAPQMAFYADPGGSDIRMLWARGDASNIVFLHGGDVAGNPMDVWPVSIASVSKPFSMEGPALVLVQFAVPDAPVTDLEVP